jgi:1-acyl-sn-glycerol-3-phosphate acyltransferase
VADATRVTAAIRDGAVVCVFPEGTFVRRPGLLPFRLGAFKAAVEAGCPIVPVVGEGWREMVRLRDAARAAVAAALDED